MVLVLFVVGKYSAGYGLDLKNRCFEKSDGVLNFQLIGL
jgi:hypothetical protein